MPIVIDENGLTVPTQDEMRATALERLRTKLEGRLREDPTGVAYRLIVEMVSEAKSETAAALQAVVSALFPGTTYGEFLTEMLRFNGLTRNESLYSTVTLEITANAGGMNVPADTAIAATVAGDQYLVIEPIVLSPSASGTFSARSVSYGAFTADADEITEISTPLYGWDSVTNPIAVTPGRATETDPAARRRRWRAARGVGQHHAAAIKRALEDINGVDAVNLVVNSGTETSAEGVPPGFVWPIVWGGDQQDIVDTLFGVGTAQDPKGYGSIGAGIGSYGDTAVVVTDTETGQSGTINYTIGNDVPIYIVVQTRKDPLLFPSGGDELIKEAIVDFFDGKMTVEIDGVATILDAFEPGEDIESARIYTPANAVDGHNIQAILIGRSAPPTSENDVTLDSDERGVTSTAIITVESVT